MRLHFKNRSLALFNNPYPFVHDVFLYTARCFANRSRLFDIRKKRKYVLFLIELLRAMLNPKEHFKIESVGRFFHPYIEMKILNPDKNGISEVIVKGPMVMQG